MPSKYSMNADPGEKEEKLSHPTEFGSSDSAESSTSQPDVAPFAGMGKNLVLKYSDTPLWNRLRAGCLIIFWAGWFALLGVVIYLTVTHPRCRAPVSRRWWQTSSVYQLNPAEFKGSDGNKPNLKGLAGEMSYLSGLNVETLWLRNTYQQDTAGPLNQTQVNSRIGSVDDMKKVLSAAHKSDMTVILDFIPDYVSINHPWFNKSRNKQEGFDNFFIWAPCSTGTEPNNWVDGSKVSMWSRTNTAKRPGECYLHLHGDNKPTLNLRNNQVLKKLDEILKFWLELGVDGFRLNDVSRLVVDYDLRNNSADSQAMTSHLKENTAVLNRWRRLIDDTAPALGDKERVLMGSVDSLTVNLTDIYYGEDYDSALMLVIDDSLPAEVENSLNSTKLQNLITETLSVQPSPLWNMCDMDTCLARLNSLTNVSVSDLIQIITLTLPGSAITCSSDETSTSSYADFQGSLIEPSTMTDQMSQSLSMFKELEVLREKDTFKQSQITFHKSDQILAFTRLYEGLENFLVAVNIGDKEDTVPGLVKASVEFHTASVSLEDGVAMKIGDAVEEVKLKPGQGVVLSYAYEHGD